MTNPRKHLPLFLIIILSLSLLLTACGSKPAEESTDNSDLEYLTATESDFTEMERILEEIPELTYADFDYKEASVEDVICYLIPGYTDTGYRFFFDDDELVSDSKDPEGIFKYGHYKVPEANMNWIISNIFNVDPSSGIEPSSEFAYNQDGYYYILSGDAGLITYEPEIADYEQTEDGLYNIRIICKPYESYEDEDENEEITVVAGLKFINGIRQWTFFEINGMDFSVAEDEEEPEDETPVEAASSATSSDIVNKFSGSWYDLCSSRCGMEINYDKGSDMFYITIRWGNSYNDTAVWLFKGRYDSSINGIAYTGEYYNEIVDDSGNTSKDYKYTNGSGKLYFKSDGYIYWKDNVENAGSDCYFGRY